MADAKAAGRIGGADRSRISTAPAMSARSAALATIALATLAGSARAQVVTPDPQAWRPLSYADLRRPSIATRTYADIWQDAIDDNNRLYLARGDARFRDANAPATEAHYVIWSARRSVVVSVLNTATSCSLKEAHAAARATVKLCPLRIAIFEGVTVRTMDGGRACFLELAAPEAGPAPEPSRSAAYGSYDPAAKIVKLGLVIEGRAVDGCSLNVPLDRS